MKKVYIGCTVLLFLIFINSCQQNENSSNINSSNDNIAQPTAELKQKVKGINLQSSENVTDAPFDLQFIDTLSAHDQNAVEIATPVAANSENSVLKKFAGKILKEKTSEIDNLKTLRETWYRGQAPAINMEMPGMMDSMKGVSLKKLENSNGKQFDLRFLDTMINHEEGAVTIAKEALNNAEHTEVKTLAGQIIKTQETEIKQMQAWQINWNK